MKAIVTKLAFVKQKPTAFELHPNNLLLQHNYPFWFCGTALSRGSEAFFFPPRPVIEHVTDHYTADAAADKAAFIILSVLTDKQAFPQKHIAELSSIAT